MSCRRCEKKKKKRRNAGSDRGLPVPDTVQLVGEADDVLGCDKFIPLQHTIYLECNDASLPILAYDFVG